MISASDLRQRIDALPRHRLALLPTPIEAVPRLGAAIGVDSLVLKRDDMTGLAFGGNKVRELDFIIGEAIAQSCDTFIAGGGVAHSNHARQCAAAAIRAGLRPVLVLRSGGFDPGVTGNLLITQLLGAEIVLTDGDAGLDDREAMADAMNGIAACEAARGARPYVLRSSVHPLAAVAYVECALELLTQLPPGPATIFVTSMGATVVGLRLAAALLGLEWSVVAVPWRPRTPDLEANLAALAGATADRLGLASPLTAKDFTVVVQGGPSYGVQNEASSEAFHLAFKTDAVTLDPVYSAKGMAGLIAEAKAGRVRPGQPVVFVHTGGLPAIFTYADQLIAREAAA